MSHHIGRHWPDAYRNPLPGLEQTIEECCPCPVEPCGLVDDSKVDPSCTQHNGLQTIRSFHPADECPAKESKAA